MNVAKKVDPDPNPERSAIPLPYYLSGTFNLHSSKSDRIRMHDIRSYAWEGPHRWCNPYALSAWPLFTPPASCYLLFFAVLWIRIHCIRTPDTDPDPAFQVKPDADPVPFWIEGFDDQKLKINTAEYFFISFLKLKNPIYWFLDLFKGRPSYVRSLQSSKENIQHFKT